MWVFTKSQSKAGRGKHQPWPKAPGAPQFRQIVLKFVVSISSQRKEGGRIVLVPPLLFLLHSTICLLCES